MLLGGKCERCGNNDMRVLHFDHINGNGSKERKELGGGLAQVKRVLADPFSYQILCANCHAIKHSNAVSVTKNVTPQVEIALGEDS